MSHGQGTGQSQRVLWLNGPFGVGKTTSASILAEHRGYACFDPELLGFIAREVLAHGGDFQDLHTWQFAVPAFVQGLVLDSARPIVMPMTVYRSEIRDSLRSAFRKSGIDMVEITLTSSLYEMERRLKARAGDPSVHQWGIAHLAPSLRAFRDDPGDHLIDTTGLQPKSVVERVLAVLRE